MLSKEKILLGEVDEFVKLKQCTCLATHSHSP